MYRDRDFDLEEPLPWGAEALKQDLELSTLFNAMARGDKYLYQVAERAVLCGLGDDLDTITYRQDVLRDCLNHPGVVRALYQIPIASKENKQRHWMGIFSRYPGGILSSAREMLQMFLGLLRNLREIADEHAGEFESEGFTTFFAMIQEELDDDYLDSVEEHLHRLRFRYGVLISAELGKGLEGTNYVLRRSDIEDQSWLERAFGPKPRSYSFTIPPRDNHGAEALGELRNRGINLVANALAQSADHIDSFLNMLRVELAFYVGCLNVAERLSELDEPICFPDTVSANQRWRTFRGLYDVSLALTMKRKVVGNNVNANGKDLMIITGANQGGKSTFLRSLGLSQLMMQCGMFVPAESYAANVCKGLFTHYRREEDVSMESGKFDEELGRMSAIADHIAPHSMVLFNESFAATNDREGSEIAVQIIRALLEEDMMVFFVTHLYECAHAFYEKGMDNVIFLRAERQSDGSRTFKLVRGRPLVTSYGEDLYKQIFGASH